MGTNILDHSVAWLESDTVLATVLDSATGQMSTTESPKTIPLFHGHFVNDLTWYIEGWRDFSLHLLILIFACRDAFRLKPIQTFGTKQRFVLKIDLSTTATWLCTLWYPCGKSCCFGGFIRDDKCLKMKRESIGDPDFYLGAKLRKSKCIEWSWSLGFQSI